MSTPSHSAYCTRCYLTNMVAPSTEDRSGYRTCADCGHQNDTVRELLDRLWEASEAMGGVAYTAMPMVIRLGARQMRDVAEFIEGMNSRSSNDDNLNRKISRAWNEHRFSGVRVQEVESPDYLNVVSEVVSA